MLLMPAFLACGPSGFQSEHAGDEDEFAFLEHAREETAQLPEEKQNEDFVFLGDLSPTIYFHPVIRDEGANCGALSTLHGERGSELMKVCQKTLAECTMEGSCQISRRSQVRSFNYRGKSNGHAVFFEITADECSFGYGVQSSCLDPFYTVAADLRFHKPGDVLYVPKLAGTEMPDGSKHSGYMIVRDSGGRIKGRHRFDFYSGTLRWNDPRNPFFKMKLSDQERRFSYFKVKGETAQSVREKRGYPKLPDRETSVNFFSFEDEIL